MLLSDDDRQIHLSSDKKLGSNCELLEMSRFLRSSLLRAALPLNRPCCAYFRRSAFRTRLDTDCLEELRETIAGRSSFTIADWSDIKSKVLADKSPEASVAPVDVRILRLCQPDTLKVESFVEFLQANGGELSIAVQLMRLDVFYEQAVKKTPTSNDERRILEM